MLGEEQMRGKLYFVILAPICSKTLIFDSLGVHVGAHWAPKPYPNEASAAPNGRPERPRPPKLGLSDPYRQAGSGESAGNLLEIGGNRERQAQKGM